MGPALESIPGLVLWLEAGKGITQQAGKVSRWADQSSQKNDAAQGSDKVQPTFMEAAAKGRPVVRFTRANAQHLVVADSASLRWGVGDFTLLVVAANRGAIVNGHLDSWGYVYRKAASETEHVALAFNWPNSCMGTCGKDSTRVGVAVANRSGFPSAVSKQDGYNDGKLRLFVGRRTGAVLDLRINGVVADSQMQTTPANLDFGGRPVYIGVANPTGDRTFRFEGDVAEMVAIKGPLAQGELAKIEQALMAKYGL